MLKQALKENGLVAILRGLRPEEAPAIGDVLYEAGFRVIEVPLNSPQPFDSIRLLRQQLPADCLIGAGTVLTPEQVTQVKDAGGQVIVMPHSDASVLRAAKAAGLFFVAGRGDADRGVCRAGRRCRRTETVSCRADVTRGGQGVAGGAAQGHPSAAGRRYLARQHESVS